MITDTISIQNHVTLLGFFFTFYDYYLYDIPVFFLPLWPPRRPQIPLPLRLWSSSGANFFVRSLQQDSAVMALEALVGWFGVKAPGFGLVGGWGGLAFRVCGWMGLRMVDGCILLMFFCWFLVISAQREVAVSWESWKPLHQKSMLHGLKALPDIFFSESQIKKWMGQTMSDVWCTNCCFHPDQFLQLHERSFPHRSIVQIGVSDLRDYCWKVQISPCDS